MIGKCAICGERRTIHKYKYHEKPICYRCADKFTSDKITAKEVRRIRTIEQIFGGTIKEGERRSKGK